MSSMTTPGAAVQQPTPADELAQRWRAEGFEPGAPAHVAEWARRVDAAACLDAVCAACDNRGLECRPFRRGRSYRVLAVCVRCGHAEEF